MEQYKAMIRHVLDNGIDSDDRTGVGTRSVFGYQTRYDLSKGFPLLTLKKTHFKSITLELLWMMRGDTNIRWLNKHGVTIWDEWAHPGSGDLGPVYGHQWRKFNSSTEDDIKGVDQLTDVIERIKTKPNCRRLIVSAWNPSDIPDMNLPPCHSFFQFYVRNGKLSCQLYQRSADLFLGVPFNIASYALLLHLVANECDLEVGEFVHTFGDLHIYKNHFDQAKEVLNREEFPLPTLEIDLEPGYLMTYIDRGIDSLGWETIKKQIILKDYKAHPAIKAEVAV